MVCLSKNKKNNKNREILMKRRIYFFWIIILALMSFSDSALAQFGKNKVQYQNFKWKFIQSKHFDVYYYDSKYLAEACAVYAEQALKKIQSTLDFRINKRISIIAYDTHNEFQQTNVIDQFMSEGIGGVTELKKNRIVVPFQGNYAQFKHVVHHELVHGVLNEMLYGGTLQTAVGSGRRIIFPLWMNEGLAEYSSIEGMNTQTDMFMRDVVLSENLKGLNYLYGYFAYRGGQTFYWYVEDKYGKEKVGDLVNRMRVYGTPNLAFKSAFHKTYEEFSEHWVRDLKKFYLPDIEKFEHPDDYARRITDHEKDGSFYNSSPTISPDGERMAYISAHGANFGIYISDFKDKDRNIKMLVNSNRMQDFEDLNMLTPGISWNPEGTKLAISAKSGGEDAIFIVDAISGDYDKLTFGIKSISSVSWSPDGKNIVFIGSEYEQSNLMLYNFEAEELSMLTNDIFAEHIPSWSPDSKTIYFVSDRGEYLSPDISNKDIKIWKHDVSISDIYSIELDSKTISRLTYDPKNEKTSLAVIPDGTGLLYVSDANGIGNIYQYAFADNSSKARTNSLTGITQISLASDASKLIFSTQINGGYDIFMLKFPLDKPLLDSLPVTKFKQSVIDKQKLLEDIAIDEPEEDANSLPKAESIQGYGGFEIDFTRQQVVKPNPDVAKKGDGYEYEDEEEEIDDSSFTDKEYKLKFSPDLVLGNPGYSTYWGFQGVAQVLFSDVLGDHQLYLQANLLIDIKNSNFFATYFYLPKAVDYSASAYHQAGFVRRMDDTIYRFRNWGFATRASYPFDRYNRFELGLNWMNPSMENIQVPGTPSINRLMLVPEVRYVHDNVQFGYFAPVSGSRYNALIRGTPSFGNDGINFLTFKFDYRKYFRINQFMSFAFRGSGAKSFGSNAQRFFMGGTENWINRTFNGNYLPLDQPEDFAFMEFIMPLRGAYVNEISGTQYFLLNAEYRFPMVMAWMPGMLFQNFMGAVFFDMGGAWSGGFDKFKSTKTMEELVGGEIKEYTVPNNLLMSTGIGIRSYVLGLPMKLDIAWLNLYWNWSTPMYMFSLGYDF